MLTLIDKISRIFLFVNYQIIIIDKLTARKYLIQALIQHLNHYNMI
jgi:hypothetical protein